RRTAHAVVAPFDGLVGGVECCALYGFGVGRHLHVAPHLMRGMVVRDLRVATGVILPHVRAQGSGEHLPPRAHQERGEKSAHGQVMTPHKSKLQMYSETV